MVYNIKSVRAKRSKTNGRETKAEDTGNPVPKM
jgi:hypothetical protein